MSIYVTAKFKEKELKIKDEHIKNHEISFS